MSNWKETIRGMLFESEESSNPESKVPQMPQEKPAAVTQSPVEVAPITSSEVEVDEKLLDSLERKLKDANIPGPDYLELKSAAEDKAFISNEPDESKRWSQAFSNMKMFFPQAGITKVKILSAVDHYIGVIREEIRIGKEELKVLMNRDVTQEEASIAKIDADIAKKEQELEKMKKQREDKVTKIEASRQKYEHQGQVFERTTNFIISALERDKQKINEYIKEV